MDTSSFKPKISILLPCFGGENLLTKVFIPSLKNCSENVEVLLLDNTKNGNFFKHYSINEKEDEADIEKLRKDFGIPLNVNIVFVVDCGIEIKDKNDETNSTKYFFFKDNHGLNKGLNLCGVRAKGDYFFTPHLDMYLMPGWDTTLLDACKNLPPCSFLFCSRSIEPKKGHTEYHIIKNYGQEWNEFDEFQLLKDFKNYSDKTILSGYRMPFFFHKNLWQLMIKKNSELNIKTNIDFHLDTKQIIKKEYPIPTATDPKYFSYCTDDDLIQTAFFCGTRRFWMIYDSLVYHLGGKSNIQQKVDKDANWPYKYFVEKWKPHYPDVHHPGQYHPKLIPWYVKIR